MTVTMPRTRHGPQRMGSFKIDQGAIRDCADIVEDFFRSIGGIVVRAELRYDIGAIEYTVLSDVFRDVQWNESPLFYPVREYFKKFDEEGRQSVRLVKMALGEPGEEKKEWWIT